MSNEAKALNSDSNELEVDDMYSDFEFNVVGFDVNDEKNRIENQPKEKKSFDYNTFSMKDFQLIHLKGGKVATKETTSKAKKEPVKKTTKKEEEEKTVKKVKKVATDKTEKTTTKSKTSTTKKRSVSRPEDRE